MVQIDSKIREIRPVQADATIWSDLEEEIRRVFKRDIYLPLARELGRNSRIFKNSTDELLEAIRQGRVSFDRGKWSSASGRFKSSISRELKKLGAVWNRKTSTFDLPASQLTIEIVNAIQVSEVKLQRTLHRIDRKLSEIFPEKITEQMNLEKIFDRAIFKLDRRVKASVKDLTVMPEITKEMRQSIAKDYTKNMELYIQDWTEKEIVSLRKQMHDSFMSGARYEGMVKTIQSSYRVGRAKAKFLARQETGLLTAKFTAARYVDAGVREYRWRCVAGTAEHPVRPMHKELNDRSLKGEIFRFDDPPIDSPDGSRHNPRENYNCRCKAIPVVRFETVSKRK